MKTKRAARTVIIDEDNLVALIDVRDGEYYKIPGGGIEKGETEEAAAKREALEEAGCDIEIIKKIGEQQFEDMNPKFGDIIHHSVCYLAKKVGDKKNTSFDEWEKSNKMKLIWVTFPKAIELFSKVNTHDFFGSEINKRDFGFVLKAKEMLA
ncbi:NUDIX domain-containing protein [Candidatus Shapirobacteria bacterium]|nr:NUDIX domain-containing protein [Candidatus Shapirobacteria bacterium]